MGIRSAVGAAALALALTGPLAIATPPATGTEVPSAGVVAPRVAAAEVAAPRVEAPGAAAHGVAVHGVLAPGAHVVSPAGNDAGPGTRRRPWRTIGHAAEQLTAGQTAYIRAGTYRERVVPRHSGSAGAPITYAAFPGERPLIDGASITLPADQAGLVDISGREWISVVGLRVANAGPDPNSNGILVRDSANIVLERNKTVRTRSSGIGVWSSSDVVVRGNRVVSACTGGQQESISIAQTDTFLVEGNTVRRTAPGKEGIAAKDGVQHGIIRGNLVADVPAVGIYVDAWESPTSDIQVVGNTVRAAGNGISVASEMGGALAEVQILNNLVSDSTWVGIVVSTNGDDPSVAQHPMDGISVVNNTVWHNGYRASGGAAAWGGGIAVDNPDARNVLVRNNIVSRNNSFQLSLSAAVPAGSAVLDHNLVDGYRGATWDGESYGDAAVTGRPLFVRAAAGDVHLRSGSPAIDAGSPDSAPPTDFDGRVRPVGMGVDIGAFEYVPAAG